MATPRKDPEPFKTDLFSSPQASAASLSLGVDSFSSPLSLAPALTSAAHGGPAKTEAADVKKVPLSVFQSPSLGGSGPPSLSSGATPPSRHSPQPAERKPVGGSSSTISLDDLSTVPLDSPVSAITTSGPPPVPQSVLGAMPLRSATDPAMTGTTNLHGWNDPPPLPSSTSSSSSAVSSIPFQTTPLRAAKSTATAEPSLEPTSDPFAFQTNAAHSSGLSTTPPTNASVMAGPAVPPLIPPPSSSSSSSSSLPPSQQQLLPERPPGGSVEGNPYRIGVGLGSRKPAYATSGVTSYGGNVAPPLPSGSQTASLPHPPFQPSQPTGAPPPSQPSLLPTVTPSQDWTGSQNSSSLFHWFYLRSEEKYWIPFSLTDSNNLENAFQLQGQNTAQETLVATDGGRYDVDLPHRQRRAVYWEEPVSAVRRCSWFFKGEGDRWYLPYDEDIAAQLEEEFSVALSQGAWNRRVELGAGGEAVVMHSQSAIVHYPTASSQLTPYSPAEDTAAAPKSVMRGFAEIDKVDPGEQTRVDHVVFVIHGIGAHCDLNFRSLVDCVDDFREVAQLMLKTHTFNGQAPRDGDWGGRVEFLPVHWHAALHGEDTGVDCRLKPLTLPSISRLRDFTNSTLLDILFYASPIFCQTIVNQVCSEMNRMLAIFRARNPTFKGGVSVMGHSLGSCVLFDILDHQHSKTNPETAAGGGPPATSSSSSQLHDDLMEEEEVEEEAGGGRDEPDKATPSLEETLASLGLSELSQALLKEKIDYDSLLMLANEDLKELGIAMGHRKKLASFITEEKEKQKLAKEQRLLREKQAQQKAQSQEAVDGAQNKSSVQGVKFVRGMAGTGQPFISYPQLDFEPQHLFCVGSPIGLFLSVRGVEELGPNFCLPTCPSVLNIFHPFDPVAYRLEPLVCESPPAKPLLMPHHKGRKRFHLELYENLGQVGASIKHHLVEGMRNMWTQLNEIARSHKSLGAESAVLQVQNEEPVAPETPDLESHPLPGAMEEGRSLVGQLNRGRRVDHVLQEKPIEKLNQYIFALSSHLCYWRSEDTALFILKETYNEPCPELVKIK